MTRAACKGIDTTVADAVNEPTSVIAAQVGERIFACVESGAEAVVQTVMPVGEGAEAHTSGGCPIHGIFEGVTVPDGTCDPAKIPSAAYDAEYGRVSTAGQRHR